MIDSKDSTITLKLSRSMTLNEAANFYNSSKQLLEDTTAEKICIDAVENEVIEFPILQILVCIVSFAKSKGMKLVWNNPSIALFEKSVELGLDDALGL